ncbi:MAG: helix-turn-helix transcriptional regulator, partial [bacterium]
MRHNLTKYFERDGLMADKNRIFRIIKTIMLLNEPYKHWDAGDFANYFDISERTFHRDKKIMEELGVPIYYDNHLKEYKILDNFRFKSPNLDQKETEAVLLAAKEYENRSFPMKKELE